MGVQRIHPRSQSYLSSILTDAPKWGSTPEACTVVNRAALNETIINLKTGSEAVIWGIGLRDVIVVNALEDHPRCNALILNSIIKSDGED